MAGKSTVKAIKSINHRGRQRKRPIKTLLPPPPLPSQLQASGLPVGEPEPDYEFKNVSELVKRRRERFVKEYIKDFNGAAAMRRLGYTGDHIRVQACMWLAEPYTEYYLAKLLRECDANSIYTRNEILGDLKREANTFGDEGSHAARISAMRAAAKIQGMEITKVQGNITTNGGVMTIPLTGSVEEWEKAAAIAQEQLKQSVRD